MSFDGPRLVFVGMLTAWLVAAAFVGSTGAQSTSDRTTLRVRAEGHDALVVYSKEGSEIRRYVGFEEITDLAVYDESTVLVAERERDSITALNLDGRVAWTIPVRRPRCVAMLGPDRFLVCQDGLPSLVEVDRKGQVVWQLPASLGDIAAASPLPDGNIVVAELRHSEGGVHIFNRAGERLWTTAAGVHHQGLAILSTGEIATAGLDRADIYVSVPFSTERRTLTFCCQSFALSASKDGSLLASSAAEQSIGGWEGDGRVAWSFKTDYPPRALEMLPDGTVLVAVFIEPDHQCLDARAAAERSARPFADYWVWLFAGVGAALVLVVLLRHRVLWRFVSRCRTRRDSGGSPESAFAESEAKRGGSLDVRRRREIGFLVAATAGLVATAAVLHARVPMGSMLPLWPYAALVGLAGLFLVALQVRTPRQAGDWGSRMAFLQPLVRPTAAMWILWLLASVLFAIGLWYVRAHQDDWGLFAWSAALVLFAGGALQEPQSGQVTGRGTTARWTVVCLVLFAALLFLRVYRLEDYPANLHLDMAQWTVATRQLLDGHFRTIFADGYAQVSLTGFLWSAFWNAIAGGSLAGARFASVAGSLLTLWAVYLLARRLYGREAAVVSSVVLGVNHAFLHFSRIQAYMDPVPFNVLAVLGLVAGLETGRYSWFALAGLSGGYSALTYHAGRITPLVMVLVTGVLLLRYPRALVRRWPGLLLAAVGLAAMVGPYVLLYATGRMYVFGREEVYPFWVGHQVDIDLLLQTLRAGLPKAFGAFWSMGDSSSQYGSGLPVFLPAGAALLGISLVAAVLRPVDCRGLLLFVWATVVVVVGGALTVSPNPAHADIPAFWPRFVISFVPTAIAIGSAITWLRRGTEIALGRPGRVAGALAATVLLAFMSWRHLSHIADQYQGIRSGLTHASHATEWSESIMGRDVQKWGAGAMIYIVSRNPRRHSCQGATMQFYATGVDLSDARDIRAYLPFEDQRTIVCYFPPEEYDNMQFVRQRYPDAEEKYFENNLGKPVFARLVVRSPHS